MATYFNKDLKQSLEDTRKLPIDEILAGLFPDLLSVRKCVSDREDILGSDVIVHQRYNHRKKVDLKFRSSDTLNWGHDDLAIEIWSVYEKRIPGYYGKETDYIVWIFKDTLRAVAVPFPAFRHRVAQKRQLLLKTLPLHEQTTINRYGQKHTSYHVFAPTWLFQDILIEPHNPSFKKIA